MVSITIPNSVTSIDSGVFSRCSSLTSVDIGDSVTTIEVYAFSECTSLASISIPNSVTSIRDYAFSDCSSLASVHIPVSSTEIGENPFRGCVNLSSFTGKYAYEDNRCLIVDGMLVSFAPKLLISYEIPNSVATIGVNAFYYCTELKSITIPNSVTTIDSCAFIGCQGINSSVDIPNSVTTIGRYAFCDCSGITSVNIGDSVTTIEACAFFGCSALISVTLGSSLELIRESAFSYCSHVISVYSLSTTPPNCNCYNGSPIIEMQQPGTTLYVPVGCLTAYMTTSPWDMFYTIKELDLSGLESVSTNDDDAEKSTYTVYNLLGESILQDASIQKVNALPAGFYIINGKKTYLR